MISVVIPTYNEEASITRCLESLLHQNLPRNAYEIIVVDGGSVDRTRELARPLADRVILQTSKRVGGARNDGAIAASGEIIATTDADCWCPPNWLSTIQKTLSREGVVLAYGPVQPIERNLRYRLYLGAINLLSALGHYIGILDYSLGCNTAFRRDVFIRAGMYRCIDAGDDIEIARRMKNYGKVVRDRRMRVGFSMRRYQQFGTLQSLYEWFYIVIHGGETDKYSYSRREYEK